MGTQQADSALEGAERQAAGDAPKPGTWALP